MSRGFFSKRNLAIIFGAALVLTVAITAAAVGVGHPNVPSDDVAVIDDASIDVAGMFDNGVMSKTDFNRFLLQTAKQNNLQQVPQTSDPQYKQLKDQTMQSALQIGWIVGEANRQGLSFTDTQIQQSLSQIKSQFKTQQEYEQARDQAGLTDADVLVRARLQLIQNKIQENISNSAGSVSDSDARDYYDANKQQFTIPAKRTIRIIQNKDANQINQAKQALEADSSPASWKKVAAQFSTDTTSKDKGGLRTDVVPGSFQQPLDDDIFSAPTHQLQGPVTTPTGTFIFEVESATPEQVQGFDDTVSQCPGRRASEGQRPDQDADQEPAAAGGADGLRHPVPRLLEQPDSVRERLRGLGVRQLQRRRADLRPRQGRVPARRPGHRLPGPGLRELPGGLARDRRPGRSAPVHRLGPDPGRARIVQAVRAGGRRSAAGAAPGG